MNATPIRTKRHRKTLALRLASQRAELATCTTPAETLCVLQAILDTERQIRESK